jgi:hypothetical protein
MWSIEPDVTIVMSLGSGGVVNPGAASGHSTASENDIFAAAVPDASKRPNVRVSKDDLSASLPLLRPSMGC